MGDSKPCKKLDFKYYYPNFQKLKISRECHSRKIKMYSPGEKIIRFMKGPNFKNMILNIVIRIILFCMFFTSEFITTPAEPFVANYNEWQTAYAKPIQRDQFCSDFFLIIVCSIGPILTFGLFSLCISGSNKALILLFTSIGL